MATTAAATTSALGMIQRRPGLVNAETLCDTLLELVAPLGCAGAAARGTEASASVALATEFTAIADTALWLSRRARRSSARKSAAV